jgi:hypothetical protein
LPSILRFFSSKLETPSIKSIIAIGFSTCWLATTSLAATDFAVIPQPQNIERAEGAFKLTPDLVIATDAVSKDTGKFLAERLRPATGYSIKTKVRKGTDQTFEWTPPVASRINDTEGV